MIPEYRDAGARGQVELSTSPFYHPILPLLCDSDAHLRAHPEAARPRVRFARPEDARLQIDRAIAFHEAAFGHRPLGMWPSEGSVSDQALQLIAEAGLSWVATDEDILSRSLGQPMRPELLYRPYRVGAAGPAALFRDHALSDRIGFQYQSWDAARRGGRFPRPGPRRGPSLRRSHRRGSRHRLGDPRRRERVGALPRRRPPVPARALRRARTRHRHPDGDHGRGGGRTGDAVAGRLSGVVDQRRLLYLDRPSRRSPRVGSAVGRARHLRRARRRWSTRRRGTGRWRRS